MRLGEDVDDAEPRRPARGLDFGISRELALVALGKLAVFPQRELTRDKQQRASADGRNIVCDRRRRFGQNDAHLFQAFSGVAHSGETPRLASRSRVERSCQRATLAYVTFPVKASLFLPCCALRFGPKRGCAGGFPTGRRAMG